MGPGFESPLGHHVGAKSALLRRFFMLTHKKASSARSLAPPFQIATASLGFDLGLGANLEAVASIRLRQFIKIVTPSCVVIFMDTEGDFACSGQMNCPCAEGLPAAKRSYGAKAPPARRPELPGCKYPDGSGVSKTDKYRQGLDDFYLRDVPGRADTGEITFFSMVRDMKLFEPKDRTPELITQLLKVWEASVRATHLFLSDGEIEHIKVYVPQMLKEVPELIVAEAEAGHPVAFMGVADRSLEMLFVAPEMRGRGIGKQLLQYGIESHAIETLTVNEQNPQAIGFYEHVGFRAYKRTELDEQGNPYPLLYMRYAPLTK